MFGVIVFVAIIASFGTILNFITDFLWFKEVGYTSIFLKKLVSQLELGIPFFLVILVLIYLYLMSIKRGYYKKVNTVETGVSEKVINGIALVISVIFAIATTIMTTSRLWFQIMNFANSTPFKTADPIFHKDISFYIFALPLVNQIYNALIILVGAFIAMTVLFYFFLMTIRRPRFFTERQPEGDIRDMGDYYRNNGKELLRIAVKQLAALGIAFFVILGIGYYLKQFELLYSPRGVAYGASFTDINITLWEYRILIGLSLLSAALFAYGLVKKKVKIALTGPVLMVIVSIAGNLIAMGVQNFVVAPDEINKESKYLEYNIKYTKLAYGLDKIKVNDFPANDNLTSADIEKNKATIDNIRINDYEPTKQFYNQRQSIRQYYVFNDVDVDRYLVNGRYTQVFLSAREIDETQTSTQWINQHLKYTHGYGITLSPVNQVTSTGQPDILIQNIPPESSIKEIQIKRPEIYFGELTDNYIVTDTNEKEFDYPKGDSNAYNLYKGSAGIRLSGLNKLLFAIREHSMKMLVSNNITNHSKILIYRNIEDRVNKIAPFITYDKDPYLIVDGGKLYWMIDAYTLSSYFPYSKPYDKQSNYIRNSIKVTIDAYNGDTKYYIVDPMDPLAETLSKTFPKLFLPLSDMPSGIKAHMRYPQPLLEIQSAIYKQYHMSDVKVFYQGEDLWDISKQVYGQETQQMQSNYFIMKLPGETKEEFILSIPYTPKNKDNMSALLVARNDGVEYGKLVLYKGPKEKTVYGPMQIENRITQDSNISKELSLWGARASRGNLLTIPINGSLIYVEPIYLKSSNENSLPEVKRVIVAYADRIAYESTLKDALESLFGENNVTAQAGEAPAVQENTAATDINSLIRLANDAYNKALEAQKNGDWAGYGNYIKQLKDYLQRMQTTQPAAR